MTKKPLDKMLEESFYSNAVQLRHKAQSMSSKLEKLEKYWMIYRERFTTSDSRSIANVRNLAMEIATQCSEMIALQKTAKMSRSSSARH